MQESWMKLQQMVPLHTRKITPQTERTIQHDEHFGPQKCVGEQPIVILVNVTKWVVQLSLCAPTQNDTHTIVTRDKVKQAKLDNLTNR